MTKYKEVFKKMLEENREAFDSFLKLHNEYALNPDKWQEQFNNEGKKIQKIIRIYEDRLCGHAEGSGYGRFAGNLAEKFQEEVRKHFPKIDNIGIITEPPFSIKKINL
jgi:hypothetical protein